jgi:hypothetical protein
MKEKNGEVTLLASDMNVMTLDVLVSMIHTEKSRDTYAVRLESSGERIWNLR